MSKYNHYEMCEKIFGSRYKFDNHKNLVPYSTLSLAVADKCKFENACLKDILKVNEGKVLVPKKEQCYLEQASFKIKKGEKI